MLNDLELQSLWDKLLKDEPVSTRAILAMSKYPAGTTDFLRLKLRPLTLSEERLHVLIAQLGGQDDDDWQHAYRELEYFDPRLAMGLQDLMNLEPVQLHPTRHRLVDVLSGCSLGESTLEYETITLRSTREGCNFFGSKEGSCGCSWWAEARIERLNTMYINPKKDWTRIVRALALLESFGTSDGKAAIEEMASGHPEAQPTRIAASILTRLEQ